MAGMPCHAMRYALPCRYDMVNSIHFGHCLKRTLVRWRGRDEGREEGGTYDDAPPKATVVGLPARCWCWCWCSLWRAASSDRHCIPIQSAPSHSWVATRRRPLAPALIPLPPTHCPPPTATPPPRPRSSSVCRPVHALAPCLRALDVGPADPRRPPLPPAAPTGPPRCGAT